ncbi:hypothetical protein EBR96_06355 [bacterium]|nr:hypothetical protein [bacterium]
MSTWSASIGRIQAPSTAPCKKPFFSGFKVIRKEGIKLQTKLKLKALLVTRSEKGMSLIHNHKKWDIPTKAKDVYDITGAGDTVIATLTLGIAAQLPFETASALANYAAGVVVGKLGTSTVTISEIETAIRAD